VFAGVSSRNAHSLDPFRWTRSLTSSVHPNPETSCLCRKGAWNPRCPIHGRNPRRALPGSVVGVSRGLPLFLTICTLAAVPLLYPPLGAGAVAALFGLWALTPARGRRA